MGEPSFLLPYKENYLLHLTTERRELALKNKQWLDEHPDIFKQIVHYYLDYKYPDYPETDTDASLYKNGFWQYEEERICKQFHQYNVLQKGTLIDSIKNRHLKNLCIRLLGRHFPDALAPHHEEQFNDYKKQIAAEKIIDFQGRVKNSPWMAIKEIAALKETMTLNNEQYSLLNDLETYLKAWGESILNEHRNDEAYVIS